ncbi:hypothetical protein LSAT2_015930 [Lamellibrachia satsuma]|nr:hypothetical protein LSAT2_015930 [Lamellibrachia satsuma]
MAHILYGQSNKQTHQFILQDRSQQARLQVTHQLFLVVTMTRFSFLLVLLVVVAIPCGAWLYAKRMCGGDSYKGDTHVCCAGKLYEWLEERNSTRCCKEQIYNVATHICCRRGTMRVRIIPVKPGKQRWATCTDMWKETSNNHPY